MSNIPQTIINDKKIELYDVINDIIRNAIDNVSYDVQIDITL